MNTKCELVFWDDESSYKNHVSNEYLPHGIYYYKDDEIMHAEWYKTRKERLKVIKKNNLKIIKEVKMPPDYYNHVNLEKNQAEKIQQKTHIPILFSKEELEWLGNEIYDLIAEDIVSNTSSLAKLLDNINKIHKNTF